MRATGINHVSVVARNLQESIRFYRDMFGMEPVTTPSFAFPAQWMRIGDLQFHLFEQPEAPPRYQHIALTVDDFAGFYLRAKELGIFERETFGHHVYELPGGCAQMYIRDPAGNCIELDTPDAAALDRSVVTDIRPLALPQSDEDRRSTLFLTRRREA